MKELINIKNNDNIFFLWWHIRYLNPLKIHSERIVKAYRRMVNDLDYKSIEYPICKNYIDKIEKKYNICINVFCYEKKIGLSCSYVK